MTKTKILAIETSTDACSVALHNGNKIIDRFAIAPQQHTKIILPMIQELLTETKLTLKQLDAIAFGCGPGSFTGARLAASITQGIALGANLPVLQISSLRALAQETLVELGKTKVYVAQDARMQEIYWGEYQVDPNGIMQAITPDQLMSPMQIKNIVNYDFACVGQAWKIYRDILSERCNMYQIEFKIYPQAKYLAQIAASDFAKGLAVSPEEALPTYLRENICT